MLRLIGAVMVGGCTTWLGIRAAAELRRRVRMLDELEQGIAVLGRELELAPTALHQLLARAEACSTGSGKQLFEYCGKHMEELDETSFSQIWREALKQLEDLDPDGRQCMMPLGDILGRYGWQEQKQAISLVAKRLRQTRIQAEESMRRQGRVYQVLGLSGGGFLIILLL